MAENNLLPCWAVVELMGHVLLAGRVSETVVAGAALLRIDVPASDGLAWPLITQVVSPGSLYRLTPVTEEVARQVARRSTDSAPAWTYALPRPALPAPAPDNTADDEEDDDDDYPHA